MRRSTKRYFLALIGLMMSAYALAQFDPQVGLYMFTPASFNPAAAGENDLLRMVASHRMDFVGIERAPMSTYVTADIGFGIKKTKHGAGVRFLNDQAGLWTNQALHIRYAYRQKLGKGYLAIGAEVGFINLGFKGSKVNLDSLSNGFDPGDKIYIDTSDPYIPKSDVKAMKVDLSVGAYYSTKDWFVGAAYSHLTQPRLSLSTGGQTEEKETQIKVQGTMYIHGGYNIRLKHHKQWRIRPSAMVMTDFASWDINLTALCEYKDKYRWGVGYRMLGSVNILASVEIISGLELGYTMEIQTSRLMREGYGSHEFYLAYGLNVLRPKQTNKYKSIRYL